jgi:hypothetical protein
VLESLKKEWELSILEEDLLESVLTIIGDRREKELKQLLHLLNEEEEELLATLHQRTVEDYACYNFDLVSSHSEVDLIDALKDLNFDFTSEVSDEDMINSLEDDGWIITRQEEDVELSNFDYVDNLLLKDIYDKFEASNTFERQALRDKILKL